MPWADNRLLNSLRIQRIIETRASQRERLRPLTFIDRLDLVNAMDDEIMGRATFKQLTADIIADGQKALVYESGAVELITNQLANIKIGQNVNQAQLNLMERLTNGPARAVEEDAFLTWEQRFGENLVQAVYERLNMMACAMMIDSFTYNRWGLNLTGFSWGMPSNLKVTVSPLWSLDGGTTANVANARPIRDILNMDRVDADYYGLGPFDRVTMSNKAFDIMTQSTEFLQRAQLFTGTGFTLGTNALNIEARELMRGLMGRILNKEVVIDDKTYRTANNAGATSTTRVLPENKVLLDRTTNGANEWDWGNGVVTESIVAQLIGNTTLGENPAFRPGGSFGPLGYYTPQDVNMNPPGVNGWAVCRGFPRKHVPECSAVLTVF